TAGSTLSYTERNTPIVLESALTLADRDSGGQISGASVVIQNVLNGDVLSFSNLGYGISGSYDAATGTLTLTGTDSLAHYQAVLRTVSFSSASTNPTDSGSNTARSIAWHVSDDGTPLQSTSASTTVAITAINDAPILQAGSDLHSITEDVTNNPGQTVASFATGISDPDGSNLAFGIAIEGLASGNGRWQYSRDNGQTWSDVGAVSSSNALLLLSTDRVRFVPNTETGTQASLSYRAWDTSSGQAGSKVSTTVTGGTSAFSTALQTAHLQVTDVNDAPTGSVTITGLVQVGETLSASNTLADVDGGMGPVSYAWYNSEGTLIGTGASLVLSGEQVGKGIRVVASYADALGNTESVSSASTTAVTVIPPRLDTTSTQTTNTVLTTPPAPLTVPAPASQTFSELPALQSPVQLGLANSGPRPSDTSPLRPVQETQSVQLTRSGSTGGNFPIVVSNERDGLALLRGMNDITLNGARNTGFAIPADAFSHSDPNALVSLNATQANGQPLPAWLRFDPATGRFQASPPPGARGTVEIRVSARDNQGHVVSTTFKLKLDTIGNRNTHHDGGARDVRLAGRGGLSEQLQQALRPHKDPGHLSAFLKGLQSALHDKT
ncbi:MAG: putative Ig domain-containing protein, partial [Zoogloea sp.]|uniref:putative Ig domain-containing protein n=1 Tax=Zoogloea sp. TaxID=49181 RepID=UPI003F33F952